MPHVLNSKSLSSQFQGGDADFRSIVIILRHSFISFTSCMNFGISINFQSRFTNLLSSALALFVFICFFFFEYERHRPAKIDFVFRNFIGLNTESLKILCAVVTRQSKNKTVLKIIHSLMDQ